MVTKVVTAIVVTVCRGLPEGLNDHGRRERGAPTRRRLFALRIAVKTRSLGADLGAYQVRAYLREE